MKEQNQLNLEIEQGKYKKDVQDDRMQHWIGMPEYVQEKIMPYKELTIRFKTEEDFNKFFQIIDQKPPNKLKSFWFPKTKPSKVRQVYIDES